MVVIKDGLRKYPVIDTGRCSECLGCAAIAPNLFRFNHDLSFMEIAEHQIYPKDIVNEAIKNCPKDCISWEWVESDGED